MMPVEWFIFIVLVAMVVVAIVKKVLYLAFIIVILGIAYYSGLAGAAFELLTTLLPDGFQWIQVMPLPFFIR